MSRVYNFSAGPAVLPEEVLQEAADEMLDYRGCGMSVMEMSHRSKTFAQIIEDAESDLRDLLSIPDEYAVLFLQGGASQQFAAIPMNMMLDGKADYIVSGSWSKKAFKEAQLFGDAQCIASSEDGNFSYIPDCSDLPIREDADYVYICENETIYGTKYHELYGGVQKNIGTAGVAIDIIRKDLIKEETLPKKPTMLKWKIQYDNDSLYNTPPAYGIYICGKVFKWIKKMGGLEVMGERNREKAQILYDFLDQSDLFMGTARREDRSIMNVPFITGDPKLDELFVAEAKKHGIESIKGHRTVGGMRASIYNAMPKAGVEALVAFMKEFELEHK